MSYVVIEGAKLSICTLWSQEMDNDRALYFQAFQVVLRERREQRFIQLQEETNSYEKNFKIGALDNATSWRMRNR